MSPLALATTQRLAFTAGKTAVRKAISSASPVLHPFLGTPAVLHSCGRASRHRTQQQRKQSASSDSSQQAEQPQQPQQHHHTSSRPAAGRFRRLRLLCASTVRALPAAGVKAAVLGGVQHLSSVTAFAGLSGAVVAGLVLGVAGKGARRWHAGRRAAARRASAMSASATNGGNAATDVTILSFNIRGVMDRWPERAPVLRRVLKQADADVVCFQEVLTGEFQQEQLLLGSSYQVHECRAALQHVRSANLLGAALSSLLSSLLGVSWFRSLLVSLPESVEGWRERNKLAGGWARLLRDLAIVPFYGNSIATRVPATSNLTRSSSSPGGGGSGSHSSSSSSSWCWPPAWCGGTSSSSGGDASSSGLASSKPSAVAAAAAAAGDILVLGDFRAAQRVCLKLKLSPPKPSLPQPGSKPQEQQQQQLSRQELQELIQQQMKGYDDNSSGSQQQKQQQTRQQGGSSSSSGGGVVDVWLVNTHLDHASAEIRARQMQAICSWVAPLKATAAAIVVTGDLNAPPDEHLHVVARRNGFASTHKVVHGSEPTFTWPSGIIAPLMDEGDPHCADYIYVWQAAGYTLQVLNAQLCGDRPAEADSTLYPSDHLGIKATLRITSSSTQQQQQ